MNASEIVFGKTYRIRDWDEMASDPSLREEEHYICKKNGIGVAFIDSMRYLCGENFTPKSLNHSTNRLESVESFGRRWVIQPWMIEEAVDLLPSEDLFEFLLS